jgi:hypothetical protein
MKTLLALSSVAFFLASFNAVARADETPTQHAAKLLATPLHCDSLVVSANGSRVAYCGALGAPIRPTGHLALGATVAK